MQSFTEHVSVSGGGFVVDPHLLITVRRSGRWTGCVVAAVSSRARRWRRTRARIFAQFVLCGRGGGMAGIGEAEEEPFCVVPLQRQFYDVYCTVSFF